MDEGRVQMRRRNAGAKFRTYMWGCWRLLWRVENGLGKKGAPASKKRRAYKLRPYVAYSPKKKAEPFEAVGEGCSVVPVG